jgi:hypothetical protein
LSGLGTLTAAPAFAGTTTMTGLGSLTAAPVFTGTASLSGSGTLSANPTAPANATLTGLGTLTAAPFFAGTASLSGVGSLSATPAFTPVAALSGSGTLSAAPVFAATVTLSGVGTLTATPQLVGPVPGALLMVQQPRPPPPAPPPQILPGVQQDFLVVLGDMQPAQHTTAPPTVVAAQISALNPQPVYVLIAGDCTNDGDNTGFSGEFANFDSMYGGIKPILRPAPGNHDWGNVVGSGNLTAYDTYWGSQAHSGATPPHFYSFDTPTGWHVITFDSSEQWVGSLNNPSSTYTAIAADLAANKGKPIIAYWHHPRWSDGTNTTDPGGTGDTTVVQDIWNLLRDYACDLVFTGHCHSYQRFPKFGKTASADAQGIREFVVGTGGSGLFALTGAPGSPARSDVNSWQSAAYDQLNSQWFGFLKLWLTPSTYSWQFVSQNAAGSQNPGAILDSGGPVPTNLSLGATQGATTATLTGIGSLSATPVFAGTAPMSGVGSLTATPNFTGTANLTGQGTLSATETIGPVAGLSGAGTLTATPVFAGSASLSGQGTLTAAPVFAGTVPLSGVGTLSASPVFAVAASLSGVGTLSAAPTAPEQVTLSGLGTLSAAETLQVTAALSGAGTLSTTGGFSPSSTMSGLGTLTASPAKTVTVNLTGLGTLTATETLGTFPLLSGAGTLSAALRLGIGGGLAGLGTLTGTVTVTSPVLFGRGVAGQTPMPHAAAGQAAVAHGASGQTVTAHGAAGQVPVPFALAGQMATPHAEAGDV